MPDVIVFERGDRMYLVAPVQTMAPTPEQIEEFAFAAELKRQAPNPHLKWMRGQYVEADAPNLNRQMWTAGELAIKALTPMFMPVTVMHDPRTAVGLIADVALRTPEKDDVPRSKIDTVLGLWGHRFPDVVEEAEHNAAQGTLMQSMECLAPEYSCSDCGMTYVKLPDGFERDNWCEHLKAAHSGVPGETSNASRILGNVVFTGTGLIFGSRGAEGANPEAHLEVFQDEVAELHRQQHSAGPTKPRRTSRMPEISVDQAEWDRIKRERDEAIAAKDAAVAEKAAAEKLAEEAEAGKVKAETEKAETESKLTEAEEAQRETQLRDDRMAELGEGFKSKLGTVTKTRVTEQAGKMTDEEWKARLDELAELVGVKPDDDKPADPENPEGNEDDTFKPDEVASANFGGGSAPTRSDEPSLAERRTVMAGLTSKPDKSE